MELTPVHLFFFYISTYLCFKHTLLVIALAQWWKQNEGKWAELHAAPHQLHLEAKDDGPDEAQSEAVIPVHNIVRAHVFQVHFLLLEKLQGLVHILQTVNTHTTFGGPWLKKAGGKKKNYRFQIQRKKHFTVTKSFNKP